MQKLSKAVFAAAFGVASIATASPASAEYLSGNVLYRYCTGTEGSFSQASQSLLCSSYIQGAHDGLEAAGKYVSFKANMEEDPIRVVCVPSGVETGQLKEIVVAHLRDNPADRNLSASVLVLAALAKAYPCSGI